MSANVVHVAICRCGPGGRPVNAFKFAVLVPMLFGKRKFV